MTEINLKPLSDQELREAVLKAFAVDQRTRKSHLRVGVMNSVVHLAGVVSSLPIRQAAEAIAGQITGVRGVVNRIDAPGAPSPTRVINLDIKD